MPLSISQASIPFAILATPAHARVADRWWPEKCWAPLVLERLPDGEKRKVRGLNHRQALPGWLLREFAHLVPNCEIAIEPGRLADNGGVDIDKRSAYLNPETVARFRRIAESWGARVFICSSSLYPDGRVRAIRIYCLFGRQLKEWQRSALILMFMGQAGMKTTQGQAEVIPQPRDWGRELPVGHVGQRYTPPFVGPGSRMLDDQLQPLPLTREQCLALVDELASQVNHKLIDAALAIAKECKKLRQAAAAAAAPPSFTPRMTVARKPRRHALAPGATNEPLVLMAGDFCDRHGLTDLRQASEYADRFLAELQNHPDYDQCSQNTIRDLEHGRAARLLKSGIRYRQRNHADRKRRCKAQEGPSPASPLARQLSAFRRLLWGLERARSMVWRTVSDLGAWLVANCGVSNGFIWKPLTRPVWQWMVDGDRQESREYQQARKRISLATPHTPPNSQQPKKVDGSIAPHSSAPCGVKTPKTTSTPVPDCDPAWAADFDALCRQYRSDWGRSQRKKERRAEAAARIQKRQERHDSKAPAVLIGDVTDVTAEAAQVEDVGFWQEFDQKRVTPTLETGTAREKFAGDGWYQTQLAKEPGNTATRRGLLNTAELEAQMLAQLAQKHGGQAPKPLALTLPADPVSDTTHLQAQLAEADQAFHAEMKAAQQSPSPVTPPPATQPEPEPQVKEPDPEQQQQAARDAIFDAGRRGWAPDPTTAGFRHAATGLLVSLEDAATRWKVDPAALLQAFQHVLNLVGG